MKLEGGIRIQKLAPKIETAKTLCVRWLFCEKSRFKKEREKERKAATSRKQTGKRQTRVWSQKDTHTPKSKNHHIQYKYKHIPTFN